MNPALWVLIVGVIVAAGYVLLCWWADKKFTAHMRFVMRLPPDVADRYVRLSPREQRQFIRQIRRQEKPKP